PITYNGTTYLPVRGIATELNMDVTWDEQANAVRLTSKAGTAAQLPVLPPATTDDTYTPPEHTELDNNSRKLLDTLRSILKESYPNVSSVSIAPTIPGKNNRVWITYSMSKQEYLDLNGYKPMQKRDFARGIATYITTNPEFKPFSKLTNELNVVFKYDELDG